MDFLINFVYFCIIDIIDLHFFPFCSLFLLFIFPVFLLRGVVCERGNMEPGGWGGSGESKRTCGEDIINIYSMKDERSFKLKF